MKQIKDTDYLHITARIRCLEQQMLDRTTLMRILEAQTGDDAVKILVSHGWTDFEYDSQDGLERAISARREEIMEFLYQNCPHKEVIEIFRLQYDYHNIKAILKGSAQNVNCAGILSSAGLIAPQKISYAMRERDYSELEPTMAEAIADAADLLARTGDPQLSDILLDRALASQIVELSLKTASGFLHKYIEMLMDTHNIKAVARLARMNRGADYIERVVCPGGSVDVAQYMESDIQTHLGALFAQTLLENAVNLATAAIAGEATFAQLDKACDNALIEYLRSSKMVPFGEAVVIAYLLANEAEFVSVRTVFYGRDAMLPPEEIAERLRVDYV